MNPIQDGRIGVNVATSKTLTAADAGVVQNVTADGVSITLPATATATVRSAGVKAGGAAGTGANKSQAIVVTGTVAGLGGASAAATFTLPKASQKVGDEIHFVGGSVTLVRGAWVRS